MAQPNDPAHRPAWHIRYRTAIIATSAAITAALTASLITVALTPTRNAPPQAAPPATVTPSPVDTSGLAACKTIEHSTAPDYSAPDRLWQMWTTDLDNIATLASQSSNRDIRRAGEDLRTTLDEMRVRIFVERAATSLRLACDREDYINLPTAG